VASIEPGSIVAGSWRYRLTKTDLLWAARMVEGETLRREGRADDARAVLWSMTALFSPQGQRAKYGRRRFSDFSTQIRAYSQPINPRWLATGEFCRPGGRWHGTDGCSEARLRARERLQRTPWNELDPELRRVVIAWATGKTRNPVPKAIEFAAHSVAMSFIGRNPGSVQLARIHNTFIATAASLGWTSLPTIEAHAEATMTPIAAAAIAAAAVGGLAAWAWSRRGRSA